jgi:hypothetical protein
MRCASRFVIFRARPLRAKNNEPTGTPRSVPRSSGDRSLSILCAELASTKNRETPVTFRYH